MIKCCRPIPFFARVVVKDKGGRHTMPKVLRQKVIKLDLGEAWHALGTAALSSYASPIYTVVQRRFEVLGLSSTPHKSPSLNQIIRMIAPLWLLHKAVQHYLQLGATLLHSHQGG